MIDYIDDFEGDDMIYISKDDVETQLDLGKEEY